MEIFERVPRFSFKTKDEAEAFCKRIKDSTYKYDVVTINDILRDRELPGCMEGYHYGYSRKLVKKIRPEKNFSYWEVTLPLPGRMIRDDNGYWTVEETDILENLQTKEGG